MIVPLTISAYEPLDREEVEGWLKSITVDELINFVIKWDFIEKSKPVITPFTWVAMIEGNDVLVKPVFPVGETAEIFIGGEDTGFLHYGLNIEEIVFEDLIPESSGIKWYTVTLLVGAGLLVGTTTGIILALVLK